MNTKLTWIVSSALVMGAMIFAVGPASAHTCETVGQKADANGCNAHSCPEDGNVHDHWHDTAWWDWSQTDHGCTSDGKTSVFSDGVGVPSVNRCDLLGIGGGQIWMEGSVIEC